MPYPGSYLWRLRQAIGHELVLMPGAMIALQRDDQRVLLTKRTDDGTWCLPAGAAEPGGSFARTAIDELAEETGIEVLAADLVPFGCLSEAEAHTIHYPNGDVTHCFALLFLATAWEGAASPTRKRRRTRSSLTRQRPPSRSILRPVMRWSSCDATSKAEPSSSAESTRVSIFSASIQASASSLRPPRWQASHRNIRRRMAEGTKAVS
jgi:ADP-ribose pyrophosphatase YjhB (NUDIX family)